MYQFAVSALQRDGVEGLKCPSALRGGGDSVALEVTGARHWHDLPHVTHQVLRPVAGRTDWVRVWYVCERTLAGAGKVRTGQGHTTTH